MRRNLFVSKIFCAFILLLSFMLSGCDTTKDFESYIKGEVANDVQPYVVFKDNVVQSNKTGYFYATKAKLNSQDIDIRYNFVNTNKLMFYFPKPLQSNTSYTFEVSTQDILKETQAKIKSKTIVLKFKTQPISLDVANMQFVNNNAKTSTLKASITLSQDVDIDTLKKSITLQDKEKNKYTFNLNIVAQREFSLESQGIETPKNDDKEFSLTFSANTLGLRDDAAFSIALHKSSELKVTEVKAQPAENPSINIYFSHELAKNVNLKDFIQVSPATNFNVAQSGNSIHLSGGFVSQTPYTITILKGIKAENQVSLKENYNTELTINDILPSIVFSSTGVFLPQSANKKVAFKTINVKKVHAKISRIYPNNLTQFLYDNSLTQSSDNIYDFYRIGDEVLKKDFDIAGTKNTWIQNELDLSSLKDSSGIFIIELSFDKQGTDYRFGANDEEYDDWRIRNFFSSKAVIKRYLVFSSIALIAQRDTDTITATALNVTNNQPLSNVKITAINKKNQTIAQSFTNSNGDVVLNLKKQEVFYLLAESKGESTILKLAGSELNNDGFDVGGELNQSNVKAFIYSDRGVYRPGDSLHLNVIVRSNDKPLPDNHPIFLTLTTPREKKALQDFTLNQVSDGMYYYKFDIPKNADTGVWNIKIKVGDNTFYKDISVETIVPDRIKVALNTQEVLDLKETKQLNFEVQSDYLFGAPASDLDYKAEFYVQTQDFVSKLYKNYTFSNATSINYVNNDSLKGKLDSKGFAQNSFDLSNIAQTNKNLVATILTRVYEKSSRPVVMRKKVLLKQYDSFVGIGTPSSPYIATKQEINLPIIAIASDDSKLLVGHKLAYKIYRNNYSWWWDYDDYNDFLRSIKTDKNTEVIAEGTLISKDKPINLKYNIEQKGDILVEVTDLESGASSSVSLYAREWGDPLDAKKITALKIATDKTQYVPGETAKISFESVAGAKALITLNKNGKILKRFWKTTQAESTSIDIPIDSSLAPNAYVSVSLLQDYNTTDNDRSLRLYGVVPLMVKDSKTSLTLNIQAPKEILPNSDFEVKISNAENKQATFTLAIVDEGLLSLTSFKTPNPWAYFYAKLALALQTFDTYDLMIGKTFGKVHNILKAGGDESIESAKQKQDEHAERFKPVVLYSAPIKTDEKGRATLKFKMPAYMGDVRVMAVASNQDSIGFAQENIKVTAPVVILPTLPRTLKIGDKFSLPVEVFPIKANVKNATISIKTHQGLVKFKKDKIDIKFTSNASQTLIFEGEVTNAIGVETIDIALQAGNFNMVDSTDIDIKATNPYITLAQKYILPKDKLLSIESPKDFVIGSNHGFITISSAPILSLDHRLRWLIHYPYGCIEQTTSSVLPQLFIDKLSNAKFVNKEKIAFNINAAIRRIQGFQVTNGGFSYWQGDSKSDAWGSNYAGHFLILAKQNGYYVPDELMKKWKNYQIDSVKSENAQTKTTKIYSLYLLALAGEAQLGIMNGIYENSLKEISTTDKWLLAASYKLAGNDNIARDIAKNLSTKPDGSQAYYEYSYGSALRDEAIILSTYRTIYGTSHEALLNNIVKELESDSWQSTQTLGYSLMTLASIKEDSKNVEMSGEIQLNQDKQKFQQNGSSLLYILDSGKAQIKSTSAEDLYVSYVWEGIPLADSMPEMAKNIMIQREFLDDSGKPIDVSNLTSGTSFWIKISLSQADKYINISNIALTQGLPSGWEIENLRLNDDSLPKFIDREEMYNIAYTDIRDDKIMWFFNYDSSNIKKQNMYVKINVVTPGEYTLPATYAEAMYDNNYQASIKAMKVKVKAK